MRNLKQRAVRMRDTASAAEMPEGHIYPISLSACDFAPLGWIGAS
jgi:hypothetical protein